MPEESSYHMSVDDFRVQGHALIDWIADYQARVETLPVLSQVQPGDIRSALPSHPPARGEPFDALLADVDRIIVPGLTHWQSPNFFAFFPANASGPAILGDLLSSGLGVQGMLWLTSPACTELETHMMDWLVEMLDLPRQVSVQRPGRWCNPGFCIECHFVRFACGKRTGNQLWGERPRRHRQTYRLRVLTDSHLRGEGDDDRGDGTRKPAR